MRLTLIAVAIALALGPTTTNAQAQTNYPQQQITMVVPFSAGGTTDVVAGIMAEHMGRSLGRKHTAWIALRASAARC